ncbi:hypothetical protein LS45_24630 [Klebsiella pneumoniae]|uniref:Uncharacterized protein n=1 Tax=Klebsiella pneumoniae TaxID=573 RepID=A0AAW3FTZ9_KLEPN|nr:hypothetical protein LS45_24630 [Klebsiella pneumoniae]
MVLIQQNSLLLLAHLSLKPNRHAHLVQLNTNIQMKTVMSRLGRVRVALLKRSLLLSKLVRHWKIFQSNTYQWIYDVIRDCLLSLQ